MVDKKYEILETVFGYKEFRNGQDEIIDSVIHDYKDGNLVVACTSYGKSLLFQIPALVFGGLNIVISPLISLMQDQCDTLAKKGVGVAYYNSSMTDKEKDGVLCELQFGTINLLYVAPERFEDEAFVKFLQQFEINIFAVDEAHCISGFSDFRPAYARLKKAIKALNPKSVIAVTATATKIVQDDICNQLGIPNAKRFIKGFYRDNLILRISECEQNKRMDLVTKQIADYHRQGHNTGLVYVGTRKDAESINDEFTNVYKMKSTFYHAGLSGKERTEIQDDWIANGGNIVCTNSFAMGISVSTVRYVIHSTMPQDIDEYSQTTGRAGRDGKLSICKTFLSFAADYRLQRFFIDASYPDIDTISKFWKWFNETGKNKKDGIIEMTQAEMAEQTDLNGMTVGSCLTILKKSDLVKTVGRGEYQLIKWFSNPFQANIDTENIESRRKYKLQKLTDITKFVKNTTVCRMKYMVQYFGENTNKNCGKCDICVKNKLQ